ncbi:MAG: tRNA lysidine(34) synthetase TilS [Pseudomonadota bacterium]
MSLSAFLDDWLSRFVATGRLLVGFSGGLDSTVLLHALAQTSQKNRLLAVHINHALQPESDDWAEWCRHRAVSIGVSFECLNVAVSDAGGQSLESAARDARYAALYQLSREGDGLLTGHHREDQAETLILNLMRGSGLDGLAAMPEIKRWMESGDSGGGQGQRWHGRPLLVLSRADLRRYATEQGLDWIEDPSNADTAFDRNFIRHRVLPLLETRWPNAAESVSRSAGWLGEALQLQRQQMRQMLPPADFQARHLALPPLWSMTAVEVKAVLRQWLSELGFPPLPAARLESLLAIAGREHAARGEVAWPGARVRRYRDGLYASRDSDPAPDITGQWRWPVEEDLEIPGLSEPLSRAWCERQGIALPALGPGEALEVCFRSSAGAGDRIADLSGRRPSRSQKSFFQEAGVPPWAREYCPYLYHNGQLLGILIDRKFA